MKKFFDKINPFHNSYEPFMAGLLVAIIVVAVLFIVNA